MPSPSSSTMQDLLRQIRNTADQVKQWCPPSKTCQSSPGEGPIIKFDLRQPLQCDLKPHLLSLGYSDGTSAKIVEAYIRRAQSLRNYVQGQAQISCRDVSQFLPQSSMPSDALLKFLAIQKITYERQLAKWRDLILVQAKDRVGGTTTKSLQGSTKKLNPSFNYEYVPLLEKYFEHNAYPSATDRAVLARKSMMTDRQIEVWFQNHRNRAKKEGKDLPRLRASDPLPLKLSLESIEQQMAGFIVPESERVDTVDSDISEYETHYDSDEEDVSTWTSKYPQNLPANDALNVAAPQHAFPAAFPPSCDYDPFPVKCGKITFPAPTWMRKPATSLVQRPPVDFDDFLDAFGKLNVREGPRRHYRKRIPPPPGLPIKPRRTSTPPPKPDRSAATRAITTIPPPAPHPAFLRTSISLPVTPPSPIPVLPTVPAPSSGLHAFHSPSPQSQPATLLLPTQSASTVEKSAGRRKVAPLPRRTPKNASITHREVTPDNPPSPSNSHSPHSRTSSFGSDSSSRTRMSSSSSSSASSTLVTPLSSSTSLPETLHSPSPSVSISDFNFNPQNFADIFGGSSIRSLSPVEGLQLDFPSSATFGDASIAKQPFDFNFGTPSTASFVRAQS